MTFKQMGTVCKKKSLKSYNQIIEKKTVFHLKPIPKHWIYPWGRSRTATPPTWVTMRRVLRGRSIRIMLLLVTLWLAIVVILATLKKIKPKCDKPTSTTTKIMFLH